MLLEMLEICTFCRSKSEEFVNLVILCENTRKMK